MSPEESLKLEGPFTYGPLSGFWADNDTYLVKSYDTIIARHTGAGRWLNSTHYSPTTAKHQAMVRQAWADRTIIEVPVDRFVKIGGRLTRGQKLQIIRACPEFGYRYSPEHTEKDMRYVFSHKHCNSLAEAYNYVKELEGQRS